MSVKKIKSDLQLFIILFIILLASLYVTSYNIFNSYFSTIESSQNNKATTHFIDNISQSIKKLKNLTNDYSDWDKTYDFLEGINDEYIFNNFRHDTRTLEDLDIDFIIFTNKSNEIVFSKYLDNFNTNKSNLEKNIFKTFQNEEDKGSLISLKNNYFIVIKNAIHESNGRGNSNGYLYTGKKIDSNYLKNISTAFNEILFINKNINSNFTIVNKPFLNNLRINRKYTPSSIINRIQVQDIKNNYLFTIEAIFGRDIVNSGKNLLILFNIFITFLLAVVFFLLLRHEKVIIKQNHELDRLVDEKTIKLNHALEELEVNNKKLYHLANIDSLTKINNRRSYFRQTRKAIDEAQNSEENLCILMIDIDKFKNINDKFGHKVGDIVLINFCNTVKSIIKEEGIFGRLGGEEFVITFPNKSLNEVEKISEEIRKTIEYSTIQIDKKDIKYTVSLGLTSYEKGLSIDDILNQADELLYKAKQLGRNKLIRKNRTS